MLRGVLPHLSLLHAYEPEREELADYHRRPGLAKRMHLLGERRDVAELTAALDLATSCSRSEAFPNAVGEAMACGVPCVVTDVGDSGQLVGDTGEIVPPQDPEALLAGWRRLLDTGADGRRRLGQAARDRVLRRFSLAAVVRRYVEVYAELGGSAGRRE